MQFIRLFELQKSSRDWKITKFLLTTKLMHSHSIIDIRLGGEMWMNKTILVVFYSQRLKVFAMTEFCKIVNLYFVKDKMIALNKVSNKTLLKIQFYLHVFHLMYVMYIKYYIKPQYFHSFFFFVQFCSLIQWK